MALLKDIESFGEKGKLKSVQTVITTASGKRYTESTNDNGETVVTPQANEGLGFCPDLEPDYNVGVAMTGLLIGSADVAYDLSALQKHKVTHILNVAAALPNAFTDEFTYLNVEMYDDLDEIIMNHYSCCEKFIDEGLGQKNGVVLIHCRAGRSRSVSIAIAYLMHKHGMSFEGALAQIMESRPNADPNKAFVAQLKQLNEVLKNGKL